MDYPVTLYSETEGIRVAKTYEEEAHLLENHWSRKPTLMALSARIDALEARIATLEPSVKPQAKVKA